MTVEEYVKQEGVSGYAVLVSDVGADCPLLWAVTGPSGVRVYDRTGAIAESDFAGHGVDDLVCTWLCGTMVPDGD